MARTIGIGHQDFEQGIPANRIRKYGFAFQGKKVLIGEPF